MWEHRLLRPCTLKLEAERTSRRSQLRPNNSDARLDMDVATVLVNGVGRSEIIVLAARHARTHSSVPPPVMDMLLFTAHRPGGLDHDVQRALPSPRPGLSIAPCLLVL